MSANDPKRTLPSSIDGRLCATQRVTPTQLIGMCRGLDLTPRLGLYRTKWCLDEGFSEMLVQRAEVAGVMPISAMVVRCLLVEQLIGGLAGNRAERGATPPTSRTKNEKRRPRRFTCG